MRRFVAVLSALALVALVAGPATAVKPGQSFTTTLTVGVPPAAGSYNGGFFVPTNGVANTFVYLSITGTVAKPDLTPGIYPFYLKAGTGQSGALPAYFAAKGWPQAYLDQINAEIAGTAPFFYLNVVGTTYTIFDGFSYALFGQAITDLRVDNDYPTGTYLYVATLNGLSVQVKMKVFRS